MLPFPRNDTVRLQASLDEVRKGFSNLPAALLNPTRQIFLTEQIEESAVVDSIVWLHMLTYHQIVMEESGFWLAIPDL